MGQVLWLLWSPQVLSCPVSSSFQPYPPGRWGSIPPSASSPLFLQEVGLELVWGQVQECGWWAGVVQGQVWVLEAGPW